MTHEEYRHALKQLHLTQVGAAKMFGVNDTTSRRWASGRSPIPRAVALALGLMLRFKVSPVAAQAIARR